MRTRSVIHLSAALALTAGALLLAACGGGGSGSSAPTARPLTALSADNAPETVRSVAMALGGGDLLDDGIMPLSIEAGSGGGTTGSSPLETLQEVTGLVRRKLAVSTSVGTQSLADGERTTAQETFEFACGVSGTITMVETSSTAGYIVFNNCVESSDGAYLRLDGRIDVSNAKFTEVNSCVDQFSARFDFKNLTMEVYENLFEAPVFTATVNGRANTEELLDYCDEPDWYRVSGNYLKFVIDGDSIGYYDFDIRTHAYWVSDYSEDDYTLTLDISTLEGSIHVTTLELISYNWAEDYPNRGQIRLDVANNGYLLFTINDSSGDSAVSIEADFNGDGIVDCQEDISWEQVGSADWVCNPV
jgi:hypothetical protein